MTRSMTRRPGNASAVPEGLEEVLGRVQGVTVKTNERLAEHTSMGVGGPARLLVEVTAEEALPGVLETLRSNSAWWMMLGGGSNTIFDDAGFEGVIVKLGRAFGATELQESRSEVRAGATVRLGALMRFAQRSALAGLEFCAGIPGVLGGALAGNAGAGGEDICSLAESVEVIDAQGRLVTRQRGEFSFGYRRSSLAEDVIVAATLKLRPDTPEKIEERIEQHLSKRKEQPERELCSGCMFKNPEGDVAGRLIDRAGLKGLTVGGVSVSAKHANFMINGGKATTAEIRDLIEQVRQGVLASSGVELEAEVRFIPSTPPQSNSSV